MISAWVPVKPCHHPEGNTGKRIPSCCSAWVAWASVSGCGACCVVFFGRDRERRFLVMLTRDK